MIGHEITHGLFLYLRIIMKETIIHNCPICSKAVKAIDSKQEAESDDLVKCDGNEYYTCYHSAQNPEWRYIARKSKRVVYNFS